MKDDLSSDEQIELLKSSAKDWNTWRNTHPDAKPELPGASLSWQDLYKANLRGANLAGAKLQGSDLREASLFGANLENADLSGANLRGANLKEARLNGATLDKIAYDDQTQWPHNQNPLAPSRDSINTIAVSDLREKIQESLLKEISVQEGFFRWFLGLGIIFFIIFLFQFFINHEHSLLLNSYPDHDDLADLLWKIAPLVFLTALAVVFIKLAMQRRDRMNALQKEERAIFLETAYKREELGNHEGFQEPQAQ